LDARRRVLLDLPLVLGARGGGVELDQDLVRLDLLAPESLTANCLPGGEAYGTMAAFPPVKHHAQMTFTVAHQPVTGP
jgi:hypothetical protein